jgi:hypothetical protein
MSEFDCCPGLRKHGNRGNQVTRHIFINYIQIYKLLSAARIMDSILLQASLYLVFLKISTPASSVARVWKSRGLFFSFLQDQILPKTWAVVQTTGSCISSQLVLHGVLGSKKVKKPICHLPVLGARN